MTSNLFGDPVTNATVREIYPDIIQINPSHRAEVALQLMQAGGKAADVSKFVHDRKAAYGTGTSTLCMIYNATGNDVLFVRRHTWEGEVWRSTYPRVIQNGQWAGFLHARARLMGPSKEAVVYRGQNEARLDRDWMLAWNTSRMNYQNRVFAQTLGAGGFDAADWGTVDRLMNAQTNNYSTTAFGCYCGVSVGSGSSPEFVGIMTLDGLDTTFTAMARDVVSAVSESLDSKYEDIDDDNDDAKTPPAAAE